MEPTSSMEQQFLKKLTEIIDSNLHNEHFGVSELAEELGMSRMTLHRKVKSIIKKSVSEFIRETRLKRANELLQQRSGTVSEIAFNVGFGSVAYFNRCFHKQYGFPPGEVLKGMHHPTLKELIENKKSFLTKLRTSKILYFFPIVILLAAVLYMFIQNRQRSNIEKTIAVLPPKDIGPEDSPCIILEGFREDLQSKLYSMGNLLVSSGTTTDTYRNSNKNLQLIAKELNVNYIVEIRGQYTDNMNTIWVQLIEAKTDKHIWAETFSRGLEDERVYEIQQEIALSVAENLNITISPEELKSIKKRPTTSEAAYRFYLQGLNYLSLYEQDRRALHFKNAKNEFEKSLRIDTTFADAYLQMAQIYINNLAWTYTYNHWEKYFNYLDSGFVMIEKAKKFKTSDMSKAFRLEADYYQRIGMDEKALTTFEKSWKYKNFEYYLSKSNFQYYNLEYFESIKDFFMYIENKPDTLLLNTTSLSRLIYNLIFTGFPDTAKKFAKEMLKISNDTLNYKNILCWIDYLTGNFEEAEKGVFEFYKGDTANLYIISQLMDINVYLHDLDDALFYFNKLHGAETEVSQNYRLDIIHGYLYKITGNFEKAEEMFNNEIEMLQEQIKLNTYFAQEMFAHLRLACVYSEMGEKELALKNFQIVAQRKTIPSWVIEQSNAFPLIDNIRNEPEFKRIMDRLRTKYLHEHNKVAKLLKSKGFEPS
jgi:AraC-like DNA-binding protein/TolB-like protein